MRDNEFDILEENPIQRTDEWEIGNYGKIVLTNKRLVYGNGRDRKNSSIDIPYSDIHSFDLYASYVNPLSIFGVVLILISGLIDLSNPYLIACIIGGILGVTLGIIFPTVYVEVESNDSSENRPKRFKLEYCSRSKAKEIDTKLTSVMEAMVA